MVNWLNRLYRILFPGKEERSGKYFHRLIWVGCLSVCVPILIAGLVYYQFAMERTKGQIIDESKSSLALTRDRAERIIQGIEKESLQLAAEPIINDLFTNRIVDKPLVWHLELINKILLVKNANDFINEIYFYTNQENIVLTNQYGGVELQEFKYKNDVEQLMADKNPLRWIYLPDSQQEGLITYFRKVPVVSTSANQGILAFQVEAKGIMRFLPDETDLFFKGKEMIFVSYPHSLGAATNQTTANRQMIENSPVLQKISEATNSIDSFYFTDEDGKESHYSYVKSVFGRTYVSVIPEALITERLVWIRVVTLLALTFFIILAVIFTYFSTKRAYSPVEQLIKHSRSLGEGLIQSNENEFDYIRACLDYLSKETQQLGSYMDKVQPTLRERCLQQLINGDYVLSTSLIQDCETYGLTVKSNYVIMVVEVENVIRETRFLPGDQPIIAFAVSNVIQELMEKTDDLKGYVFPYQGKGIALLQWSQDAEQSKLPERLIEFAHTVCESLKSFLSFDASVGIGRCYSHIADVPVSYKEAEVALQYRIYQDTASVLYIEDLENSKTRAVFRYPRDLEGAIVDSLSKGELAQAEQSLERFTKALQTSQSYNFIHQSYSVLLSAVITSLEKQGGSILDILEHNLFGQLESKQTSRDIIDWFTVVLFPLHKKLTEDSLNDTGQTAIWQVSQYIRDHCTEDLSLVHCAELVGMSPSYVSRLFKKEMGINFLEFVVECKVEEAKRLLLETDQSISEIAAIIGYSERNLTRVFQRNIQMTPGMFRTAYR
ncbi:helix-turn-helix domain-containing protein [Paenibacillus agricola]|uniref:AraC family transcriptional regulator n=1 Tax=Paenibacillus agricola TaxID=2716264 RepID=A0ABX0J477_9BACL|nr:helix-turn-helix domain-containing protein [Paenibacillus agricola]NHN28916.1 AraC family transcriptional regulator [Paenibacillus agricola]